MPWFHRCVLAVVKMSRWKKNGEGGKKAVICASVGCLAVRAACAVLHPADEAPDEVVAVPGSRYLHLSALC